MHHSVLDTVNDRETLARSGLKAALCLQRHFHLIWPITPHTTGMELSNETAETLMCLEIDSLTLAKIFTVHAFVWSYVNVLAIKIITGQSTTWFYVHQQGYPVRVWTHFGNKISKFCCTTLWTKGFDNQLIHRRTSLVVKELLMEVSCCCC